MTEQRLATLRRALALTLAAAMLGIAVELLLLEHVADAWQFAPFTAMALALGALGWSELRRSAASLRAVMVTSVLMGLAGPIGVYLHYRGNVEFELEMTPGASGFALFREAMMGATPALAPGTMTLLGILGILYAYAAGATRAGTPNPP